LFRLLQVAPVEVVSLCDVDQRMLHDAGAQVAGRQESRKTPRLYGDYRKMLAEKDLDIVLIATPDHWHALPMIEAVRAGADVYVQKPTGVDVIESAAMLAAGRKYQRVVQVGLQRRSTPHLIEAVNEIIKPGKLGRIAHVEMGCFYHMRRKGNPPDVQPPAHLDYELWTGPAPMLPYNEIIHPRGWRAFMEYGNGIVGDMCVHMLDMVRWMLDLGWPQRISSSGGIFMDPQSRANITDTQTATFAYADLNLVWNHRSWGDPPDPDYPWAAILYGEKGTLKASVNRYEFIPQGGGERVRREVVMELEKFPEDQKEKDLEKHVAPAIRGHMIDFLKNIESRGRPVADIGEGHISSASCILANLALETGRTMDWDAAKGEVAGDAEANRLLRRPYRAPWQHPEPENV
jgi:predicted dehydrogenase